MEESGNLPIVAESKYICSGFKLNSIPNLVEDVIIPVSLKKRDIKIFLVLKSKSLNTLESMHRIGKI